MKSLWGLLAVTLLLASATTGNCQWEVMGVMVDLANARSAGMGATGIAVANDLSALGFNPASLADMDLTPAVENEGEVNWGAAATVGTGLYSDWSLKLGAVDKQARWGAAMGYEHSDYWWGRDQQLWNFGFGGAFTGCPTNWGVSLTFEDFGDFDTTWVNVGFLHKIAVDNARPVKVGLLVTNLGQARDEKYFVNLGVSAPLGDQLTLAVDAWDIGDWWATAICAGLEWQVDQNWALRCGKWANSGERQWDPSYTLGVGYRGAGWSVDAALVGFSGEDSEFVLTGNFTL